MLNHWLATYKEQSHNMKLTQAMKKFTTLTIKIQEI